MVVLITTPLGSALPPAPRHAITTHLPKWQTLQDMVNGEPAITGQLKSMYPRMWMHPDVKELSGLLVEKSGIAGHACLAFLSYQNALDAREYALSPLRKEHVMSPEQVTIRAFDLGRRLFCVFFPPSKMAGIIPFWVHSGTGISSRCAEDCLTHASELREVPESEWNTQLDQPVSASIDTVRRRIVSLLEKGRLDESLPVATTHDIYLYQSGMAALYNLRQYLASMGKARTALFGFVFPSTWTLFREWGLDHRLFGRGDEQEHDELEVYLEEQAAKGEPVGAIWCEVPSNPLLMTPNLKRLRSLADKYNALLVVDETIGSFCNVDVMGVADIVVTSLSKSFNGYADLLAASTILNPASQRYAELKRVFDEQYHLGLFSGDADVLAANSADYLARSRTLNHNAETIATYAHTLTSDPASGVKAVYYPTTSPTSANYRAIMRCPTEDFTPGCGCLMSIEFVDVPTAIAFHDNLNVHIGPHLGAHLTLAASFVKAIVSKVLPDGGEPYGLYPASVRISVGLEDTQELLETFKVALRAAAEAVKDGQKDVAA